MATSTAIKLFGTEEPVPEAPLLRAGPLTCRLDAGNLRQLSLNGREAIRAIQFIVRDRNWGTYIPTITDLVIDQRSDGFTVSYDALCQDDVQSFRYRATIEGRADGSLVFAGDGEALSPFLTNRTGFVVLHGVDGISGATVDVEHVDGSTETSRFPELIDPTCPFMDIRALSHEVSPSLRVTCRMEGDSFEMEDQRNWTDASYKTYVRPLALPWPYTIDRGERVNQRVSLEVDAGVAAGASSAGAKPTITVGDDVIGTMPRLGLAVPAEHAAAALERAALLEEAGPAFLVCHFDAREGHDAATMATFAALGAAIEAELVLEAVIPCVDATGEPTADLATMERDFAHVAGAAASAGARFARVAVSPASDLKCTLPGRQFPPSPIAADLYAAARAAFPDALIGGGMFSYFTELNRKRPPAELLDFVCHTTCPLVHAGDDHSLMEGLESLPYVFQTTRSFATGRPYWLFPTAISMRQNPYGAAPAENPDNLRQAMNRVDPRERGVVGAAFYAGYLAHAARAGLEALTLGATTGPSGIVTAPMAWAQPGFDDTTASVFPSFHVFRAHAQMAGWDVLAATSTAPGRLQAVALRKGNALRLILTNLTGDVCDVQLEGFPTTDSRAVVVDADSFDELTRRAAAAEGSAWPARLQPYAVCILSVGDTT